MCVGGGGGGDSENHVFSECQTLCMHTSIVSSNRSAPRGNLRIKDHIGSGTTRLHPHDPCNV